VERKNAFLNDRMTDSYARLTVLVDAKTISKPPVIVPLYVHKIKAQSHRNIYVIAERLCSSRSKNLHKSCQI